MDTTSLRSWKYGHGCGSHNQVMVHVNNNGLATDFRPMENEAYIGVGINCTKEVQLINFFHILPSSLYCN